MLKQTISKVPKILLAGALVASVGLVVDADAVIDNNAVQYAYAESTLANNNPTQEEIKQAFKNASVERYLPLTYDIEPSLSVPYSAGKLSQSTLNNVLNYLNLIRFVAGSDPVTLDSNLEQEAQAAALIQTINGELDHRPLRPANVDDQLWELAKKGSKGNLGGDFLSCLRVDSMVNDITIPNVGHRTSILSGIGIIHVGFGSTKDRSVILTTGDPETLQYNQLVWPAQNMPIELLNLDARWSYYSNATTVHEMTADNIFVTVTNMKSGETQKFTGPDQLYVGQWANAVTFHPSFTPQAGDSYSVVIEGLEEGTVSYTVNFFNATDSSTEPSGPSQPDNPGTINPAPSDKPASVNNATWVKSGSNWWYRYGDGTYPTNRWEQINGSWYHFDASGWMQTGWQYIGGKWYYLNSSGAMLTGWQYIGGSWYYLEPTGAMATGWLKLGSSWYYLNSSGAMLTGWYKVGSSWYYSNASGVMQSNKWIGNYYVGSSGAMATNTWIGRYHVNSSGLWDKTA